MLINRSRISDRTRGGCTALGSVKALLDAVLTSQLCVRARSSQIDLNCGDGLSRGLHPCPLRGLGVRSVLPELRLSCAWRSVGGSRASLRPGPLPRPAWWSPDHRRASWQQLPRSAHPPSVGSPLGSPWGAHGSRLTLPEGAGPPLLLPPWCVASWVQSTWKRNFRKRFGNAILSSCS